MLRLDLAALGSGLPRAQQEGQAMSPEEIALVRDSFAKVHPIARQAAELFYGRLFEVAPTVRPLFKGDMHQQGAKLMAAIAMVVASLDRLETVLPAIQDLARRHVAYGAAPAHYAVVGDCLIWTLGQGLGETFTPATKEAWTKAYGALSDAMIDAAYV
jgi:nitric oxide dioxygenase